MNGALNNVTSFNKIINPPPSNIHKPVSWGWGSWGRHTHVKLTSFFSHTRTYMQSGTCTLKSTLKCLSSRRSRTHILEFRRGWKSDAGAGEMREGCLEDEDERQRVKSKKQWCKRSPHRSCPPVRLLRKLSSATTIKRTVNVVYTAFIAKTL